MTRASEELLALAGTLEAYAADAKRPVPYKSMFPELDGLSESQPSSVVALANGLEAIAAALRSLATKESEG